MAEHFAAPPDWGWWIAGYFFLAGLAGGSYTLATILRIWGGASDGPVVRIGYLVALPLVVVCGAFLTIDLGQPMRFWHMMINVTPGAPLLNFKYWSPISVGTWALLAFGIFSFVSFLEALARPPSGGLGRAWAAVGSLVALFLASYTGVVLSVSNEPVWSDSWAIGALFVASALSGSAALLLWLARYRAAAPSTARRLLRADRSFAILELLAIVLFFITLAPAGTLGKTLGGPWLVLWLLVIASLIPPLLGAREVDVPGASGASVATSGRGALIAFAVIAGVFLMRVVVIFSAQS
jgi:formate-dependent nitrite reductase membrane component NrfD